MARQHNSKATIAVNLKARLAALGMSAHGLHDAAAVSVSHVYDVLAGSKAPTIDWLERVAHALDMEPWELLRTKRRG